MRSMVERITVTAAPVTGMPSRNLPMSVSAAYVSASSRARPRKPQVPLIVWTRRKMLSRILALFGSCSKYTSSMSTVSRLSLVSVRNSRSRSSIDARLRKQGGNAPYAVAAFCRVNSLRLVARTGAWLTARPRFKLIFTTAAQNGRCAKRTIVHLRSINDAGGPHTARDGAVRWGESAARVNHRDALWPILHAGIRDHDYYWSM